MQKYEYLISISILVFIIITFRKQLFTLVKAGLSFFRISAVVPGFGNSSLSIRTVSLLTVTGTGTISFLKWPLDIAASALCWDIAA